MTHYARTIIAIALLLLVSASLAFGASVSVISSGNGVFIVQGSNMDGVAAFDLALNYSSPALASPSVSQGSLISGAMLAANTGNPGAIKIAVVSTRSFSGSGPVATISFATHTGSGTVSVAAFNPINSSASPISNDSSTSSATDTTTTTTNTSGTTGTTTNTTDTTNNTNNTTNPGTTYLGTVNMPTDAAIKSDTKPAAVANETPAQTAPLENGTKAGEPSAATTPVSKPQSSVETTPVSHKEVLERFRAYHGEKTPAILIALFKKNIAPSFHQEPFVALSDGKTVVTMTVDLSATEERSPNFALNGAKLVSIRKDDSVSKWYIETLPATNALRASLLVLNGNQVVEYPLTIAPPLKKVAATEAEFAAYLKNAAKSPAQHDVNNDGTYDGVDDYIYTANFLAHQGQKKTKGGKK